MSGFCYRTASEQDISFIGEVYQENIAALHGSARTQEVWKQLLQAENTIYYIVYQTAPVGWFRLDPEKDGLWLGMLQVKPACQRQGVGKYVLSVAEQIAKEKGYGKVGIHTTEDNLAARALYAAAGYRVTEIGPCTTADGNERVGYTFEKEILR